MRFIRYNLLIILLNLSDSLAQSGENKPHDLQEEEEEGVKILPFQVPFCGDINPELKCDISCYEDSNCQTLGFDFNKFQCSCAAQICADGLLYGSIGDHQSPALTDEQIKFQPHVLATCFRNDCVPAEIAPFHRQIGICT